MKKVYFENSRLIINDGADRETSNSPTTGMSVWTIDGDLNDVVALKCSLGVLMEDTLFSEITDKGGTPYADKAAFETMLEDFFIPDPMEFGEGFRQKVTMGLVPGYSWVDKYGINQTITPTTDPEDIWEFGGVYPHDPINTAPIQYISSSDDLDDNVVNVEGLDISGAFVSQDVTLQGEAVALLGTPLWRVFRMTNSGNTHLAGTVYCHTDPTPTNGVPAGVAVRAIISGAKGRTLMAVYTVPLGKVGFLYRGEFGVELAGNAASLSEYAHCHYESRRVGGVFAVGKAVTVFPSNKYLDVRTFPDPIPALTDLKLTADIVTQDMGLWGAFDILLVDQDKLSSEYLASIGQPLAMPV